MSVSTVPRTLVTPAALQQDIDDVDAFAATLPKRDYMTNAKALISGGGAPTVDTGYNIKWTVRFLVMGAGRGATTAANGHFSIAMPPVGTVIPRVGGGAASVTVTSAGINFDPWDALYYILPLGSSEASLPANFRIVQYTSDFTVPYDWLPIATRNSSETPETIQWANGISMTPWVAPALTNISNYGAGYEPIAYCKRNGSVYLKGLGNGVVLGAHFTLPVGFRPLTGTKLLVVPVGQTPYAGRIDVTTAGTVLSQAPSVAGTWLDFDNVNFPADA